MKNIYTFNDFKNESISIPQLKYPVDKCLDFTKFHLDISSHLEITDIPIMSHGTKSIPRNSGNFYTLLNTMDPIFPEISSWKIYDEFQIIWPKIYRITGI